MLQIVTSKHQTGPTKYGSKLKVLQCRNLEQQMAATGLVIKNSPGATCDFRVKIRGTASPDDKLTATSVT
jgi:hypothetical protein